MRGGLLHNKIVQDLVELLVNCGLEVQTEAPIHGPDGALVGYADVIARRASDLFLFEVENSIKQLGRDLAKATALPAKQFWIVVPNPALRKGVERRLKCLSLGSCCPAYVLTAPQAYLQILKDPPFNQDLAGESISGRNRRTNHEH